MQRVECGIPPGWLRQPVPRRGDTVAGYTVVQGLIDAGVVEMPPDHLVTAAYDTSYGTPIPLGRKLLSIDVLRAHPQRMLELDSWINEQRDDVPQLDQTLQWLAEVWSLEDLDL